MRTKGSKQDKEAENKVYIEETDPSVIVNLQRSGTIEMGEKVYKLVHIKL